MLTALTAIIAFLSNVLPLGMKVYERKLDLDKEIALKKLEAEIVSKQLDAAARNLETQVRIADVLATMREGESLRSHDAALQPTGVVNTVRSLVRPIITFVLFGYWLVVKGYMLYFFVYVERIPFITASQALLDAETMGLVAAVFGFWFSARVTEKYMERKS